MLHIHFGAGRLGLGLVVPFFQHAASEVFILNRKISTARPTGATALTPRRRNDLLRDNPERLYMLEQPSAQGTQRQTVQYAGFFEHGDNNVEAIVRSILDKSDQKQQGVVVTASLISAANYRPVLQALAVLAELRATGAAGPVFLVACENTLDAHGVFQDCELEKWISPDTRSHVTPVHALVDRVCIGLAETTHRSRPIVLASTEEYGSLKLELTPDTEALAKQLQGSQVEFTPYVAIEKQLKSWLLNGSHWLLALDAFDESAGDAELRLNEFLKEKPERLRFAEAMLTEMCEGIAVILRREPQYAAFVRDVNPEAYLQGSAKAILQRFLSSDDPMSRILARFQAPTAEKPLSIEAFTKRFAERVDEPIAAYAEVKGMEPPASARSMRSLVRLIASGTYIDAA